MRFNFFFGGGFFYCDDNILISFLELGFFNIDVFVFFVCSILTVGLRFLSSRLSCVFFSGVLIKKIAMIHLWSLPMWIMSFASASFTLLKYLLFGQDVVNLLLLSFWRDERRLFLCRFFLNIVLSAE